MCLPVGVFRMNPATAPYRATTTRKDTGKLVANRLPSKRTTSAEPSHRTSGVKPEMGTPPLSRYVAPRATFSVARVAIKG
jgi:hypothetical protein